MPHYRAGPQLDAGVHHIAQIRMLCGDVQELQAYIQYANPTLGGPSDMTLNLHFASHAIGNYVGAHLPIPVSAEPNDMRLYGASGSLRITNREVRLTRVDGGSTQYVVESDGGYYNQLLNFYDAVVYDEPIVGTVAQSYHNMLIVMRAMDSAEAHQPMAISDPPGGLQALGVPLWRPRGSADLFAGLPTRVTEQVTEAES
jgi:predicted dehydrogenase